jgi:TRAP transporter 4TM/12TM fusion protein
MLKSILGGGMRLSDFPELGFRGRRLEGGYKVAAIVACLVFAGFVFSINSFLLMDLLRRSAVFGGILMAAIFLIYPATDKSPLHRPSVVDMVLIIFGMAGGLYVLFTYQDFIDRQMVVTRTDIVIGTITIVIALEAGRRSVGIWLSGLAVLFLAYALLGQTMPGQLAHFGVRPERLLMRMFLTTEGMYGQTLQIAQTFIALFVFFGAFLQIMGTSGFLNDVGLALSGRFAGGPAKVAVVASALSGMVSGSAAANVATTGTITIPMMKKAGYPAGFAGGVEAVASTGGMIMPPILGAAAFLMAEFTGISYVKIMLAAVMPAALYYGSVLYLVHVRAVRLGIRGLPADAIPRLITVVGRAYLILPIVVLVYFLIAGYTPTYSVMMALAVCLVIGFIQRQNRLTLAGIVNALLSGAQAALSVSVACLVAGFIVGVVNMTGVGQVFANNIFSLSGGLLPLALVLTGVAALFLSAAMPATAVYIVVVVTIAPALIDMHVPVLAAHFFVFYFGNLSNITPPVAIACFTAAGIAGTTVNKVAGVALKLAFPVYAIMFTFVYHPELLFVNWSLGPFLFALSQAAIGIVAYVSAMEGFIRGQLGWTLRGVLLIAAFLCLILQDPTSGYVGMAMAMVALGVGYVVYKPESREPSAR